MCFERVGGDPGIITPHLLQQGLTRDRQLPGTIEKPQNCSLLFRKTHLLGVEACQQLGARTKAVRTDRKDGILTRFVLTKLRANTCKQNGEAKWLRNIIVGSGFETQDRVEDRYRCRSA